MGTMLEADNLHDDADRNDALRVRKTVTSRSRKPTPLQTARWKAVRKGLGIHRGTVSKYINAESPLISNARAKSQVS